MYPCETRQIGYGASWTGERGTNGAGKRQKAQNNFYQFYQLFNVFYKIMVKNAVKKPLKAQCFDYGRV